MRNRKSFFTTLLVVSRRLRSRWSGLTCLSAKRKRMITERIVSKDSQDHHDQQYERHNHVGKNDLVLKLTVHEYSDYKGGLDSCYHDSAHDIPLAEINLRRGNRNNSKEKESHEDLEECALGNNVPKLFVSVRM
jgi:hypothetical protein